MAENDLELLRCGYAAFGLGAPPQVLDLFDQRARPPACWCVVDLLDDRRYQPRDVVAADLFGSVPPRWEVTAARVDEMRQYARRDGSVTVTVTGHYVARPRGTWQSVETPFAHVWTLRHGHVLRVVSYLDGMELRRLPRDGAGPRERAGAARRGAA